MMGSSLTQSLVRSVLHHILTFSLRTRICRLHRGLLVCDWGIPVDTWTLRDLRTLLYQPVSERTHTSSSELISLGAP